MMRCIFCSSILNKVVDKRAVNGTGEIRRRRECLKCHRRFTTYERIFVEELIVVKRDGRRQTFSPEKLLAGISKALEKRPGIEKAGQLASKIENKIRARRKREILSITIGKFVLTELKKLDKIAYLRFASVYRHFEDPGDFARELQTLN